MSKGLSTAIGCVIVVLSVGVSLPIGLYLQYQILSRVEATDLMWFLYWANVPIVVLVGILAKVVEYFVKKEEQ